MTMGIKVCKFGGSSLADSKRISAAVQIIRSDVQRRFIVLSAPGKRNSDDSKITDLLYLCHAHVEKKMPFNDMFGQISKRYRDIVCELGLPLDLDPSLSKIKADIAAGASVDYVVSRGEYLCGLMVASLLDYTFVDPVEMIVFNDRGLLDEASTQQAVSSRLKAVERAVIPGFYGAMADGQVKTFSRGGSDVTGAIIARGVDAEIYENWTDVSGLLMADPQIIDNPKTIGVLSYRELRELAYMGATVLHDEAIFPVREAQIPVNIRNSGRPQDPGTMIVPETSPIAHTGTITGVAGRKDFTVVALEKALMNAQVGFGRRLLSVLEEYQISFEHLPSGIDTMSLVIADAQLKGKCERVLEEIRRQCQPDGLMVYPDMALIATVGRGMSNIPGMAAKLFAALAQANVNIRMIDQGSSEINIIVGVETADFKTAVHAIYDAFVE